MKDTVLAFTPLIALFLTVLGWIVTSCLNARTQRKGLINSITNDARVTLTDAIRDFHDWCENMQITATTMADDDIISLGQTSKFHEERKRKLQELSTDSRRTLSWLRRLEEYETLFPGTASVRVELIDILESSCKDAQQLADQHAPGSLPPKDDLDRFNEKIGHIRALTWDLLIYLQNVSLGRITGNKIPERQPSDPSSIRLIADKRGRLSVYRPKQEKS